MKLFKKPLNKHWIIKVNHNNKKNKLKKKETQKFKKMKSKNEILKQEIKLNSLVLDFINGSNLWYSTIHIKIIQNQIMKNINKTLMKFNNY